MNRKTKRQKKGKIRENLETIISAILIALVIRVFLIEAYKIPSGSMIPTLIEGDYLLVNKFIHGVRIPILGLKLPAFSKPTKGDIIVFHYPKYKPEHWGVELLDLITFSIFGLTNTEDKPKNFIKRLIGEPGDIISFNNKSVLINSKKIETDNTINDELWEQVKDINNPEKYTNPTTDNKFYQRKDGIAKSKDLNFYLMTETIGTTNHIIQLEKDNYYTNNQNIDYLYIPKENDTLELVLYKMDNNDKVVFFNINNETKFSVGFDKLFPIEDKLSIAYYDPSEYLFYYYLGILPDNTKEILLSKKAYKHKFDSNYYFMLGDNRDKSSDSRKWGFVREDYIIGSPIIIYYPIERFARVPN